jgi:hypothetical protein
MEGRFGEPPASRPGTGVPGDILPAAKILVRPYGNMSYKRYKIDGLI